MKKIKAPGRGASKSLEKRYLFWLYKTTRDELDRIDRKFTQLEIDRGMQKIFREHEGGALASFVEEWDRYIANKQAEAKKLKFDDKGGVLPSYAFLRLKLEAVRGLTSKLFGARLVREFEEMVEAAAMENILQDNSGRR